MNGRVSECVCESERTRERERARESVDHKLLYTPGPACRLVYRVMMSCFRTEEQILEVSEC